MRIHVGLATHFVALFAPLVFNVTASRIRDASRNLSVHRNTGIDPVVISDDAGADVLLFGKPKFKTKMKAKGRARGPTNARAETTPEKLEKQNVTTVGECEDVFPAPETAVIECPEECPLMRFHPTELCHFRCISEEKCATYPGVVNLTEGYCRVCTVPGCKRCDTYEQICKECSEGFTLSDGQCLSKSVWKWNLLLAVMGVLGVLVLVYVVHLACRPVVSQNALDWGLEHRSKSKARQDTGSHDLYDLNLSLADTVTSAGGIGAALHFSWQRMTLLWSAVVTVAFMGVVAYHGRLNIEDVFGHPTHDEAEGTCSERLDPLSQDNAELLRIDILWLTGLVYVVSSVGAVLWSWWQQRKFIQYDESTTDMRDYAVTCRGFPEEAEEDLARSPTDKLEEEYKEFFKSTWGECVIGVSIAWNMDGSEDHVKRAVADVVHDFVRQHKADNPEDSAAEHYYTSRGSTRSHSKDLPHSRATCLCGPLVEAIDGLWWGEVPPCMQSSHQEESDSEAMGEKLEVEFLRRLKTTGSCFVVLRTHRDMDACRQKPLPKFRGTHDIEVFEALGGAETVLWDGFATTDAERCWLAFIGVVQILLIVGLWTLCFWGPYTLYILSWGGVAGMSQGEGHIGMVVGLLITVGNQIVYAACGVISENAKYACRDMRDSYYTGLYTGAVLVNTILDIWLVSIMASGWQRDAAADPNAIVRNPSIQHALFDQFIFYLWPCTLLLPFLLEPLVLNVGPYYLASWLVRSRPACSKQEAEECLVPPPFDLNRYGDNLINILMVAMFFLLTGVTIWWIFLMLTVSLWAVFAWDCYRFKRGTMRTHFATQDIDILANYMMAFPCAVLASGFVFKARGGQGMVADWDPHSFLTSHGELWMEVGLAFFAHIVLHWLLLALVVPRCLAHPVEDADYGEGPMDLIPYETTAEKFCCNWFNANPVHCLRSRYLYRHEPPHVFYQPGREYLHKKNSRPEDQDALIIYEASDFVEEEGIMEDMGHALKRGTEEAIQEGKNRIEEAKHGLEKAKTFARQGTKLLTPTSPPKEES
jgi:hypothetical protein